MFRAPMPEAAIDKNGEFAFGEREIRFAYDWILTPPIGDSILSEELRKNEFGILVTLALHPRHDLRALRLGKYISHGSDALCHDRHYKASSGWVRRWYPFGHDVACDGVPNAAGGRPEFVVRMSSRI